MKRPPDKKRRLETPLQFDAGPSASGGASKDGTWDVAPRFIIIKRKGEDDFSKVSPFVVHKAITGSVGEVKNIKKLRDGTLLVEVTSDKQATRLLKCETLYDMNVEVKPHSFLNISKGVIRCFELDLVKIEEIKNELKQQKVIDVSRFTIKRDNEIINTHSYLLTFGTPEVPKNIKVGYLNIPVKLYIPNPRRCTNCLLFGHIKSMCKKNTMTCSWCSKTRHEGNCEDPIMCAVCKGAHNSFDKNCPAFILEKEIKKIQIIEKVPYGVAKKKFNYNAPQNLILNKPKFSEILTKTFKVPASKTDSGTQTDFIELESSVSTDRHSVESSTATERCPPVPLSRKSFQPTPVAPFPPSPSPSTPSISLPPPTSPNTRPLPPSPTSSPPADSEGEEMSENSELSENSSSPNNSRSISAKQKLEKQTKFKTKKYKKPKLPKIACKDKKENEMNTKKSVLMDTGKSSVQNE